MVWLRLGHMKQLETCQRFCSRFSPRRCPTLYSQSQAVETKIDVNRFAWNEKESCLKESVIFTCTWPPIASKLSCLYHSRKIWMQFMNGVRTKQKFPIYSHLPVPQFEPCTLWVMARNDKETRTSRPGYSKATCPHHWEPFHRQVLITWLMHQLLNWVWSLGTILGPSEGTCRNVLIKPLPHD